jgi:hypothetical protein
MLYNYKGRDCDVNESEVECPQRDADVDVSDYRILVLFLEQWINKLSGRVPASDRLNASTGM